MNEKEIYIDDVRLGCVSIASYAIGTLALTLPDVDLVAMLRDISDIQVRYLEAFLMGEDVEQSDAERDAERMIEYATSLNNLGGKNV